MVSHSDLRVVTGRERDIKSIEAEPSPAGLRPSRRLPRRRRTCARPSRRELPDEAAGGTPLYLLLDDMAGSTLISGFAFLRWSDRVPQIKARLANAPRRT